MTSREGDICTRWQADYEINHLADHIRDWRLDGCEHSQAMGETCSPCLRDRILKWLVGLGYPVLAEGKE